MHAYAVHFFPLRRISLLFLSAVSQEILDQIADINLVVNLKCTHCLVKQHFGTNICSHCGKAFDAINSESTSLSPCLATRTRHDQLKSSAAVDMKDLRMEKFRLYSEQVFPHFSKVL